MYKVILWDTNETLLETEDVKAAKKIARNQGHNNVSNGSYYGAVARVDEPMQDGSPGYGTLYVPVFRVGKHDNFKAVPFVNIQQGERLCSHKNSRGCSYGCN